MLLSQRCELAADRPIELNGKPLSNGWEAAIQHENYETNPMRRPEAG